MQFFVSESTENIANIGEKERRKRLIWGRIVLVVSIGAAILLILSDLNVWWRLILMGPFFAGFLGYFQAMEKT